MNIHYLRKVCRVMKSVKQEFWPEILVNLSPDSVHELISFNASSTNSRNCIPLRDHRNSYTRQNWQQLTLRRTLFSVCCNNEAYHKASLSFRNLMTLATNEPITAQIHELITAVYRYERKNKPKSYKKICSLTELACLRVSSSHYYV
jgi:hypothetical protein